MVKQAKDGVTSFKMEGSYLKLPASGNSLKYHQILIVNLQWMKEIISKYHLKTGLLVATLLPVFSYSQILKSPDFLTGFFLPLLLFSVSGFSILSLLISGLTNFVKLNKNTTALFGKVLLSFFWLSFFIFLLDMS